jgi:hypothetical protein
VKYNRGYHSSAILMPDGSIVVGGDPAGDTTPHERYLPSYFFKPRPQITGARAAVTATAPPDGNVSPPGYHLLFLVDHDRTPSLGRWIRLT